MPVEQRANWMFQIAEREGRAAWMRAVERFVLVCGIAPAVLTGSLFVWRADGPLVAIAWTAIAFLLAAIGFERLFRDWRKLPFTCSYLPGKRPPLLNLALFTVTMLTMMPVAWMVYICSTNPASFLVLLALEFGIWAKLRQTRLRTWGVAPLRYEDQLESEVDSFGLAGDGTVLAQEQFQREWNEYLRDGNTDPVVRPLEEGETRLGRLWQWLQAVPQDLRFALRMPAKKPGFAFSIVVTLGLGLGLNAAFFTIFNAFLLRPLAVRDPASLISIEFETKYRTSAHLNWDEYRSFVANSRDVPDIAASSMEGTGLDGRAAKVAIVTGNFFSVLGAGTALGRPFQAGESEAVMVLGHRTWQTRFASDAKIIGKQYSVNGHPFEVVGVAAPEFIGVNVGTVAIAPKSQARYGIVAPDFWVPMEVWQRMPAMPKYPVYGVVARMPAQVNEAQAAQVAAGLAQRITRGRPDYDRIHRATVETLEIPVAWTALEFSLPLLMAFVLTMLIPCANAANMMLARAAARQRELGTRLSLGASRGRIVRQMLVESFVLALLACAAGIAVSRAALQVFSQSLYATAPPTLLFRMRIPDFVTDSHVYFYMLLVAVLTTALFALAPAAYATRTAVTNALRGELGSLRHSHLRDALVVVQVSACVMLLATASVLLRGSGRSVNLDRGYESRGLFAVANQSPEDTAELAALLDRESWVESWAFFAGMPADMSTELVANPARPGWENAYYMGASGEFFHLMRLPLLRGRTFTREEGEARAPVAVISELAALRLWPGEDPVGKTLAIQPDNGNNFRHPRFKEATIVGVCRDVISKAKDGGPRPTVYLPDAMRRGTALVVRGKGSPEQTARQLESALARSPGAAHGARVVAMQEVVDWDVYPQLAVSWLSSILGVVALLLTATGIYGVMSYLVSQRTKEIGIRIALGATPARIARLMMHYSVRMVGAGLVFGVVLALGMLQYGASKINLAIEMYDPLAYSGTLVVVAAAAVGAAVGPLRRACGVDPQQAVRTD
ncbi:MAG: ABC transporter permease [Bryobacterales bacterium]|nr:ABC transporter permease [Bryobacterales bacterium]